MLVYVLWLWTYLPVNIEDRDGQHMGVVTKALVKDVPPSSMILRVLFITCREPGEQGMDISAECYSFAEMLKIYISSCIQ